MKINSINIVYIVSGDLWAGAEVQVYHTLCDLVQRNRYAVTAILFNEGKLSEELKKKGVPFVVFDEKKNSGLMLLIRLIRLLREKKPGIVHVHRYKEHILGKLACILSHNNAAIVRTFHGISEAPKGLPFFKSIKSNLVHMFERYLMRNCNLIAVSKDLEGMLNKRYPNAVIFQIYNGLPCINSIKVDKERIREEYGVDKEVLWIATFSRLEKIKNLDMLIDAGKLLKERKINFHISIFGVGPLRSYLNNKIASYSLTDIIKLEGFRDNIMPILGAIDEFTLTSFHEGLPMSLLEAMYMETPVICTRVGGIKEVVIDRITGILIPSKDTLGLCDAVIELRDDVTLKKKITMQAKKNVEDNFSISNTNKALLAVYDKLLNR